MKHFRFCFCSICPKICLQVCNSMGSSLSVLLISKCSTNCLLGRGHDCRLASPVAMPVMPLGLDFCVKIAWVFLERMSWWQRMMLSGNDPCQGHWYNPMTKTIIFGLVANNTLTWSSSSLVWSTQCPFLSGLLSETILAWGLSTNSSHCFW